MKNETINCIGKVIDSINAPATKLIEVISKGIGTLYEPRKIRKIADAEAYRMSVVSKAMFENSYVPAVFKDGKLEIETKDFEDLQKRAAARFALQETRRQYNIECIADKAYDILEDSDKTICETVSDEWIARFISSAQDVSDKDIQEIWAKILSEEILKPNTYSYRVLEALKIMNRSDILLFDKLSPYVISNNFIPNDEDFNKKYNIKYGDILLLEECGLINSSCQITDEITIEYDGDRVIYNDDYVLTANMPPNNLKIILPNYVLSRAGIELYKIIKKHNDNDSFMEYANQIKNEYSTINFHLYKITNIDKDKISHDEIDLFLDK